MQKTNSAIFRKTGWSLLMILLLPTLFTGCAGKNLTATSRPADKVWTAFRHQYTGHTPKDGFLMQFSMYITYWNNGVKRGNRTVADLWGNYNEEARLDVNAGVGSLLAALREDQYGLTAYYPDEKKSFFHEDPVQGVKCLGFPLPLSLGDLALILNGHFDTLLPEGYQEATPSAEGRTFYIPEANVGEITGIELDSMGRPMILQGWSSDPADGKSRMWRMTFGRYSWRENARSAITLPDKITFTFPDNPQSERAVIRIRTRSGHSRFGQKALRLQLPDETEQISLMAVSRPLKHSDGR